MNNFIITNSGKALISNLIAGTSTVTFTKVETSDRDYSAANLAELEELKDVKQSVPVSKTSQKSDTLVEVLAAFENAEVTVGYYVRAVGLYAKDAENNEILYAVATDDNPDYIPAYSEKTVSGVSYRFNIKVGNASNVVIEVNPAAAVTQEQFSDLEKKVDSMQTVNVDSELSDTSENPVQNKVIKAALDKKTDSEDVLKALKNKVDKEEGKVLSSNDFSDGYKQTAENSESHMKEMVYGENGAHGLRYYNDALQVKNSSDTWVDIETGGGGIAPSNVSNMKVKIGDTSLTVMWSDPGDTIIDGKTLCTWKGTKLVMKAGVYPESVKDGTVVVDNQVLDRYKETGYTINGLTNGTTYYFALFPYSDLGVVNGNTANRIEGTPQRFKVMTVTIDLSNSNPETSCTYADDAVGMTAGDSSWDTFFGHYPCLLLNGTENGKLNLNNFAQFEDGSTADITSGSSGDVMIAFPRRGVKITTSGTTLTVSMTDDPDKEGYTYYAHTKGTEEKEIFYMGAYKGYESGSKLRSLSGKTPTVNKTIGAFRTLAEANGDGYEQTGFYQITFIQCMYILKYKNLNCQSAVGRGYTGGSAAVNTGGTNTKGMDFGSTSGTDQCKLFGLEDFWGNVYEWIDGLFCDSSRNILTATDGFNDTGSRYTNNGSGGSSNIGGWLSKPQGNSECGFIAKEVSGSSTTYFSDYAYLYASRLPKFGGSWSYGDNAGVFQLYVYYSASYAGSDVGARLMFR